MEKINTHGQRVSFGKHKGELFTRIPISYLRWMINTGCEQADIARAEFERRGDTMPKVELSGHAIDRASLRVLSLWKKTRRKDEGLYSWLQRMTLLAINDGKLVNGRYEYFGIRFVVLEGEEFPVLKSIMPM